MVYLNRFIEVLDGFFRSPEGKEGDTLANEPLWVAWAEFNRPTVAIRRQSVLAKPFVGLGPAVVK